MKKKFSLILLTLISISLLIGCQQDQNRKTKLVYEKLSTKEEALLNVTGNKVLMYNIENLPKDKNLKISLVYEAYKNTEKVKEETIMSSLIDNNDNKNNKIPTETLTLNIQEDKIRYVLGSDSSYASGSLDIKENLTKYSYACLTSNVNLKLGTDIYLYYGTSNTTFMISSLGTPLSKDELNSILKNNEETFFIKLVYKEI